MSVMRSLVLGAVAMLALACTAKTTIDADSSEIDTRKRDFRAYPALLDLRDDDLYVLSDPHGGLIALTELLRANGLVDRAPVELEDAKNVRWTAGTSTLIVVGDLIDKGPDSLGVIDFLRELQTQAPRVGGRVVVTMGNHEAEFLVDAKNDKATSNDKNLIGIDHQLDDLEIDPESISAGRDPEGRGLWLRNLPLGIRNKKWFFAHAGDTGGRNFRDLALHLEDEIRKHGFESDAVLGKNSLLESEQWFGDEDDGKARDYAAELDVEHIVFGHDPNAFGDRDKIEMSKDRSLLKINVEMGLPTSGKSRGGLLLHVDTKGTDHADVLDARGNRKRLF